MGMALMDTWLVPTSSKNFHVTLNNNGLAIIQATHVCGDPYVVVSNAERSGTGLSDASRTQICMRILF